MTGYQAEVVIGKLREVESLLLSMEIDEPGNGAITEAKRKTWDAMGEVDKATNWNYRLAK